VKRFPFAALVLLGVFAWATEPHQLKPEPAADAKLDLARLHQGMTATEVRNLLGPPKRTARQILYGRYLEQWTYDGPTPVRIEFDWRKGQEKQILTVQPLSSPPR